MLDNGYRVDVEAVQGALTWLLTGCVVPPPRPRRPTPDGAPRRPALTDPHAVAHDRAHRAAVPAGAAARARAGSCGWTTRRTASSCSGTSASTPRKQLWQGGSAAAPLRLQRVRRGRPPHDLARRVGLPRALGALGLDPVHHRRRRCSTRCSRSTPPTTARAMDKYLWGIAEVPASFPAAALQAQAIAARTYAAKRADRVLMPTPADQNWTGWKKETEGTNGAWGLTWKARGRRDVGPGRRDCRLGRADRRLLLLVDGRPHRGRALRVGRRGAVPARRRRLGAGTRRPATRPRSGPGPPGVTWATLASRLGFSSISTISVPPRGAGARTAGVKVVGHQGRRAHHVVRRGLGRPAGARPALARASRSSMRRTGGPAAPAAGRRLGRRRPRPAGWWRAGQVALQMTEPGRRLGEAVPLRHGR